MYLDLVLSILSSAFLFLILKKFSDWGVVTVHGILFNYFTAAGLSLMFSDMDWMMARDQIAYAWPFALGIGLLFILVFVLTGITAQKNGMATSSIASKMSMVIPITVGVLFYNDSMNAQKGIGLALALPAVLLSVDHSSKGQGYQFDLKSWILPILLFIGAGMVDSAIKYAQHHLMDENNSYLVISLIFASAGCFGLLKLGYNSFVGNQPLKWVSVMGGFLLGSVNFCSLYFLVRCLDYPNAESSNVFAIVNVGVVMVSFILGWLVFSEKPSPRKSLGLAMALASILILTF